MKSQLQQFSRKNIAEISSICLLFSHTLIAWMAYVPKHNKTLSSRAISSPFFTWLWTVKMMAENVHSNFLLVPTRPYLRTLHDIIKTVESGKGWRDINSYMSFSFEIHLIKLGWKMAERNEKRLTKDEGKFLARRRRRARKRNKLKASEDEWQGINFQNPFLSQSSHSITQCWEQLVRKFFVWGEKKDEQGMCERILWCRINFETFLSVFSCFYLE